MKKLISKIILAGAILVAAPMAHALDVSHYATQSVLADGKWARVKVSETGMHLITDTQLKSLGFSDPSKVHIYGTGGQMVPEALTADMPDDLPLLPSVRTKSGIIFYAVDWFSWKANTDGSDFTYTHTINPYSDESYYFLSDKEVSDADIAAVHTAGDAGLSKLTTFRDRLVHEQDLQAPGESGRVLLGEDFRTNKSQTFNFQLPDNTGDDVAVLVNFYAKTTNGTSSLIYTANGTRLKATSEDAISAVTNTDTYFSFTTSKKTISDVGEKLAFQIDYSYSGALFMARLNYIEVFYTRKLQLKNGALNFYQNFTSQQAVELDGCSSSTVIWDVTNPSAPAPVNFTLNGSKAVFAVRQTGYREFIAFEPDKVSTSVTLDGAVQNQNIHGLATPDMLIISPSDYIEGANRIAALHESVDGMTVHVLTPQQIYNEFSGGSQDVSAFRKLLKMWYDRPEERQIGYCLIMGKPTYDPKLRSTDWANAGFTPVPIWQSIAGSAENTSFSSDDYIGMLADGIMGVSGSAAGTYTYQMAKATLDVAVGRIPVRSASESIQMASKIESYVKSPEYGAWRNKVMIIADDADSGAHMLQANRVYNSYISAGNGSKFLYDRLFLDNYTMEYSGIGAVYPLATKHLLANFNEGIILTNYIGHASEKGWGHEHLWEWESINSMTNKNLSWLYSATCKFCLWDTPELSGAEVLMLNPTAGIIGMMGATRTVLITQNGDLNERMSKYFFKRDAEGLPQRIGDIYRQGRNENSDKAGSSGDGNALKYAIMGDPALRMLSPTQEAEVTAINGIDVTAADAEYPEVQALGKLRVQGDIKNPDGSVATDFNGTVNVLLYDAERVVETKGNGGKDNKDGYVCTYNDRTTKLAQTNTKVVDGKFDVTINMPAEIENNYTTARITLYAWDGNGEEANGDFDRFYVYGYSTEDITDADGPNVEYLYLNNSQFRDGDLVSASPVLFARVSDDSGINLSEAGIGHMITAVIDGTDIYDDLSSYFTSDPEDSGAGTITYPLSDLTPGEHTLTFTVWDNVNNSTRANLQFNVGAAIDPVIYDLSTNVNPASSDVTFRISIDRPNTQMNCTLYVYDLSGRKVWEYASTLQTDMESTMSCTWDLCDGSGARVPRGIYIYRAVVESPEGTYTSKSQRLAVTAE
jgi:hypothetical protein